ncbi:ArsR/SmtB family transcription factor [Kaistia terrae]|uniref:ArsR/SmtB family transcription factor n=1 Tax=Kaistia terrae TaxID=537017 RepID=A0ABW0PXR1_9HYPH|nr:metalloregulator ArsR/SmtB family transcription factor [Kaistia terrae]MCX5581414.1 metalloregulator ArsR/SmtB family transcription factor [Kaistia terrae]
MVEHSAPHLNDVFHALADPTRRAMVARLSQSEQTVSELAAPFSITLAAASKHIKVLERAGLVARRIKGRTHLCRLEAAPLHAGMEWMRHYEKFWQQRLDILDDLLAADDAASKTQDSKDTQAPQGNQDTSEGAGS